MPVPVWVYNVAALVLGMAYVHYSDMIMVFIRIFLSTGEQHQLIIGVMSARGNFAQRQAIRDTWWGFVQQHEELADKVQLQFVLGSQSCPLHVDDREDEYSCTPWVASLPQIQDDILAVKEAPCSTKVQEHNYGQHTLNFRILHPVILTKLGIHSNSISGRVSVRLLDSATHTDIVSTMLSRDSPGVLMSGYRYKAVEPYLLPKGFQGYVLVENLDPDLADLPVSSEPVCAVTNTGGGVIKYLKQTPDTTYDGHYTDPREMLSHSTILPSFIYTLHAKPELETHVSGKEQRNTVWENTRNTESENLTIEMREHDDLVILSLVDTYRNLPYKLLRYFNWLEKHRKYDFVMKVDDDCYVDVERLFTKIEQFRSPRTVSIIGGKSGIWWGRFRYNWYVEQYGKWAEFDYPASVYPAFACGSGYVLSHDIVSWLVRNREHLHSYQGEDVSLGIWLAAVKANITDDPMFQCNKECLSEMYTMPQLSIEELKQTWQYKRQCGDPCGCY